MTTTKTIYEELGVRPVLNAQGNRTLLGGSTPSPEVRALMEEASEYYVDLGDLIKQVGRRIAELLGVEAALVTSGCSAALAVAAAACMTGQDWERIERIPDTTGMPNEIIIQRQLRVRYDRCMTIPGGRLVEVGGEAETRPEDIEAAIGPNTAAIHFYVPWDPSVTGYVPLEEVIRIGHAHNVPIIVDAAGQVYPTENLSRFAKMGADLVCYGAKYFGAVNSSGLLVGRADLVEAARLNSFIGFEDDRVSSFARPMKVDRQEVVAVYAALREWLTMDHEERFARYEARISALRSALSGLPGLAMSEHPPGGPYDGLRIQVKAQEAGKSAAQVVEELRAGNPSIWVREDLDNDAFIVRMLTLKEGGEEVIAARLREILAG